MKTKLFSLAMAFILPILLNINHAAAGIVTIGNQVVQSGASNISPYNYFWESRRIQFVLTAAEISAAGGIAGNINSLAWDVSELNGGNLLNYEVKMAHTTASDASAHNTASLTTVKNAFTLTPGALGWNTIVFDVPFNWNGTDNILIDVCWGVNTGYSFSGQIWLYNNVTNQMRGITSEETNQCSSSTSTTRSGKPRVQLDMNLLSCMPPTTLGVTNLASTSATLTWTAGGTETLWDVYYGPSPLTAPDGTTTPTQQGVNSNSYNISSLSPLTGYSFYVRADCGGGDLSSWAGPFNFTSAQVLATLPFNEGFEVWPNNWSVVNGTQTNQWFVGSVTANTGTQSAYITNDAGVSNAFTITSTSTVHMYRDIEFPAGINPFKLQFSWKGMGESIYDYLRVFLAPTTFIPDAGTNYTGHLGQYNLQNTWQTTSLDLAAATYAGQNWRLMFSWRNDASGGAQPPIAIDDISITVITCPKPTNLAVSNLATTGATLHWKAGASETSWNVLVINTTTNDTVINQVVQTDTLLALTTLTPLTNYKFLVQAICGGTELSEWSTAFNFTTPAAPLSGNYTINSTMPTAGTNFNSFTHFALAANLGGLAGPVVVDVVAGTGPYNEQIKLIQLLNSSITNTLTINGNGEILQFLATVSADRYTLAFDGTDYVTVNNLIVKALGSLTTPLQYGWAVWLANGANFNTFNNCEFYAATNSTSSNFSCFVTSNSATDALVASLAASNLTVTGCKVVGGYYGLVMNGPSATPFSENNLIVNNQISDFYYYGLYLRGQNNSAFTKNRISRTNRTDASLTSMIYMTSNVSNTVIGKNRIFNFAGSATTTSAAYGINASTLTSPANEGVLISNNLIYGFTGMNGTQYGIYLGTLGFAQVHHNTVSLDNTTHPGSSLIYCFYHTGANANLDIKNNIFAYTTNSTGAKYNMYFATSTAVVSSNNNVLFRGVTAGTTNRTGYWAATNFETLANWQTANGGIYDANSSAINPLFLNPAGQDYTPQAYGIDNIGTDLLTIVPDDINDVARTATPDPGAIEFQIPAFNAGMVKILTPANSGCNLGNEIISAVIKNFGTTPITTIEMGYIVNGGTPVTETFTALNILIDEIDTLYFTAPYNFSALGNYNLTVYTNLTDDVLNFNDTIANYIVRNGHDFASGDYFMSFEPAEFFADWTSINPDGIAGWTVPYSSTAYAKTGSFSAYHNNLTTNTDQDWLFSRCFTFEQGETYELSFFYRSSSTTLLNNIDVYLMDDVSEAATPISTVAELHDFTGTTHKQSVERFTVPVTGTYYIAWKNFSSASTAKSAIDDINITLVPAQDAAVVDISKPLAGCDLGLEEVEIAIVNFGAQAITNTFNVSYQIVGNTTVVTETITNPNIAVFDTLIYEFTTKADLSALADSTFEFMAWVTLSNDPIADNDTAWGETKNSVTPQLPVAVNDTVPYGATAQLTASSNSGNILWYDDNVGTNLVNMGNTFNVDSLFNDTTFYVLAASSSTESAGKPIYSAISSTSGNQWGLVFDVVSNPVTIYSVDIYSAGTAGQMNIQLRNNAGALIETLGPFTYPTGSTANPVLVTLPLNLNVPVGTGYRLVSDAMSGNVVRESSGNSYPYVSPSGNVIIQSGFISSPGSGAYYWFYNWQVSSPIGGCATALVPVSAIVETPICYFVSDVVIDTVTQDYAAIYWTAGGSETQWQIEYGPAGFTQGTGTTQIANATVDTIFGLDHSTYYDFYVRAFCDPNYSAWYGPVNFLTQCGPITVYPYTEGFENAFPPLCWTNYLWDQSKYGSPAHSGTEWAYSNNLGSELTTPEFSIPTAGAYFSFWYKAESTSYPQDFDVVLSTDGINFTTVIAEFTGVISTTYQKFVYDLSAFAGQNIWIQFVGQYGTGGAAYGICIDDFFIDEIPACGLPTALNAINIAATTADLTWTGASYNGWQLEWDTTGFAQGTGNSIFTTAAPHILTALEINTSYQFYVRAFCMFDTTAWVGPFTFSTLDSCFMPTNLMADATNNDAELSWDSDDLLWEIEWDVVGFTQGSGNIVITDDNPYTISGLTEGTVYEFYIRTICDSLTSSYSDWAGPYAFITQCGIVDMFPWNDQFDNAVAPDFFPCWFKMTEGGETWYVEDYQAPFGTQYVGITYDDVTPQDEYLISPTFDFSFLAHPYVSFYWAMSYYWAVAPMDNYDVYLLATTDNGLTIDTLWRETDEGVFANWTWNETIIDLTSYAGQANVQLGFNYVGFDGAEFFLDNVTVHDTTTVGLVKPIQTDLNVNVYPNPSNGQFNVQMLSNSETLTITVMNIQGQVVYENKLSDVGYGTITELDLRKLAAGMYHIRLFDGKSTINEKLIIN